MEQQTYRLVLADTLKELAHLENTLEASVSERYWAGQGIGSKTESSQRGASHLVS